MGFWDDLFGTPEPTVTPTQTVQTTQYPDWVVQPLTRLFTKGEQVSDLPYPTYTGPRIAGATPDTLASYGTVRGAQGSYLPDLQAGRASAQYGAMTFPQANLASYMNPFTQNVTDIAKREAIRKAEMDRDRLGRQAVRTNNFGGARQGVMEAELDRNLNQQLSDLDFRGQQQAFNTAGQLFQADAGRSLTAAQTQAGLGTLAQQSAFKDAAAQSGIGLEQRALDQQNLDRAYQDFIEQRDYPKQNLSWLSGIIKGAPTGSTTTTQGQQLTPQASTFGQVAGLGTTALGLIGAANNSGINWGSIGSFFGFAKGGKVRNPMRRY